MDRNTKQVMIQYLIESAEYSTTKNGKEYLRVNGNTGEKRWLLYVWNAPQSMDLSKLKHKVIGFLKERDMTDYKSMSWTDAVLSDIEELPSDHPICKIKLKGDKSATDVLNLVKEIALKEDFPEFWREFLNSHLVSRLILPYSNVCGGKTVHHPWEWGLSTHIHETIEAAYALSKLRFNEKRVNLPVVIVAALFHDWGKLCEYKPETWDYTQNLYLYGHIYLSAKTFVKAVEQFEKSRGVPTEDSVKVDVVAIEHAILAHHGVKEYGSPIVPATFEAWIVHNADLISARQNMFDMAMNNEKNIYMQTTVVKQIEI